MTSDLKDQLEQEAKAQGFSAVHITTPDAIHHVPQRLNDFVAQGYHGQMSWMEERLNWRGNPAALWGEARSIIMLAENYPAGDDALQNLTRADVGNISVYARGRDYHDVVKKRLKRLARWLIEQGGGDVKVLVDTAPVAEKALAQSAGLGWQGKHTNLVSRELGNWFFLGAIFTTLEIAPDQGEVDHCGSCRKCLDICPTRAFVAPYKLDARRCISYLTIEHKGPIDADLRPMLGNRIYGCDDCLAVCPWNKFAQTGHDARLAHRPELTAPKLGDLVGLNDADFRALFSGSPIKRIGRNRFVRNILYAIGNSDDANYIPLISPLTADDDAAVVDAAHWAIMRLRRFEGQAGPN